MKRQLHSQRLSIHIPEEQWDFSNLTELQKVVRGRPEDPPDWDLVADAVRTDPILAFESWDGGLTLLHEAVRLGHHEMVRLLLDHHADVNAWHPEGTPLHCAAECGRLELVKLLLEKGANPNVPDCRYRTPLYLAALHHPEIIKILLQHGAMGSDKYTKAKIARLRAEGLLD